MIGLVPGPLLINGIIAQDALTVLNMVNDRDELNANHHLNLSQIARGIAMFHQILRQPVCIVQPTPVAN